MALNDRTIERNFGHCRVLWRIKKFSLAICKPENPVISREFSITSTSVTRWLLGFSLENDGQKLQLFLKRLDDDYEDSVQVSWKVTILDSKEEGTFIAENQANLSQNSCHYIDSYAPLNIHRVLNTDELNKVSIMSEIIVLLNIPMEIPSPEDKAIAALFKDLAFICETGYHSDIAIKLNGTTLNLHKAMLCPRSQKLDSRVRGKGKKMQLYYTDVLALKKLFAYLYTANLKFIFDSPTISMNEYIRDLDIKELRNAYPQEKISMKTVARSRIFKFHWIIPNVRNQNEMRESGVYEADEMRTSWQLRIYPEGQPDDSERRTKYVYIEAVQLNDILAQDVYVDFKAVKEDGRVVAAKRRHATVKKWSILGDRFMRLGGCAITEALIGTDLHIKFIVCEATGEMDTRITDTQEPLPFNLTNHVTYKILANHLGILQTQAREKKVDAAASSSASAAASSSASAAAAAFAAAYASADDADYYRDVVLKVGDCDFKCHKFILAGRSATLYDILASVATYSWEGVALITLNYGNKHAFRVFLDFLYTGSLTNVDFNMMMQVYDLGSMYKVPFLRRYCLAHIRQQIYPETICSIFIFAHERRILFLKTTALNFIFHNREVVLRTNSWKDMEVNNPELTREIVYFLNSNMNRFLDETIQEDPEQPMEEDERKHLHGYNIKPQ